MYRYRLHIELDDNGTFLVTSPDFSLVTYGATRQEALDQATDAAHALLASMMDAKAELPQAPPLAADGIDRLRLPLQTVLKVELYEALQRQGLTRAGLQRRLGWKRESVDRLFRLDHQSKLDQLDQAFQALGVDLNIVAA